MNENIDLTKILKNCPKGTKLYSSIFGEVSLINSNAGLSYPIVVGINNSLEESFTAEGKLLIDYKDAECVLFPSKDQRDWSKFNATLYKNDDEKMRNFIINELTCLRATDEKGSNRYEELTNAIVWLENQCKKHTDKNNPKFNIGDWVVFITSESAYQVEKKENYEYTLRYILGGSLCLSFSNEKLIREWTIQDAKDGDILVNGSNIFIFHFIDNRRLMGYCYVNMDDGNLYNIGRNECFCTIDAPVTPATKEQRDLLFQKIKEAGYKWNAETKTLEKLVNNKFDPNTLQPFDKVLVRNNSKDEWKANLFSHYKNEKDYFPYKCTDCMYKYCIPYNDNTKHLVGTTDEASKFYKY